MGRDCRCSWRRGAGWCCASSTGPGSSWNVYGRCAWWPKPAPSTPRSTVPMAGGGWRWRGRPVYRATSSIRSARPAEPRPIRSSCLPSPRPWRIISNNQVLHLICIMTGDWWMLPVEADDEIFKWWDWDRNRKLTGSAPSARAFKDTGDVEDASGCVWRIGHEMRSGSSVPDGRQPPRARDHPGADDQSVEPAPAADADVCDGALDADLQRLHTLDPASVLALVGRWILRFRRHGNQRFRLASAHPVQFQMEHVVAQNP